jgi:hypothetical protein
MRPENGKEIHPESSKQISWGVSLFLFDLKSLWGLYDPWQIFGFLLNCFESRWFPGNCDLQFRIIAFGLKPANRHEKYIAPLMEFSMIGNRLRMKSEEIQEVGPCSAGNT